MNMLNLVASQYHSFQRWLYPNEDCSNWTVKETKAVFEASVDDRQEKRKSCSVTWLVQSGWNRVVQAVNTVAFIRYGFNIHRMQKMVCPHDSLLAKHEILPILPIPTIHFATHPAVSQAVFNAHRDGDLFITDNAKGTIFQFICDMLEDKTLTPDDIIFTCSPTMTKVYRPIVHSAFSSSQINLQREEMQACIRDTLLRWNECSRLKGTVNVTDQAHAIVCDMMCRHFLGIQDTEGFMAISMKTFFDYIVSRFLQKPFDQDALRAARNCFFETAARSINDKKGLAGKLVENGLDFQQIKMILFSLMFAGMDSSASSLTYGILKCAQDVNLQNAVRSEIASGQHHLVRQIMAEGLRMFTPVIGVTRIARQDLVLRVTHAHETAVRRIPQGTLIAPSQNLAGRCPLLFPERPNDFDPARHENVPAHLNALPWSPFGGGPHMCPGSHWYEAFTELFFVEMMSRWNLSTEIADVEIEQVGHFINKLRKTVYVTMHSLH